MTPNDLSSWLTESYGDIAVLYTHDLDGGGRTYGQQFIPYVRERFGHVATALEWCAGPGFIGFSMLAEGLCASLCLSDINPAAIDAAAATVARNGLGERVSTYLADCFDGLPGDASLDLVVANPPHSGTGELIPHIDRPPIVYMDRDWAIHRRFYEEVGSFLRPGGSVVLQENSLFSSADDFRPMVEGSGLEWVESVSGERGYYFIWSRLAH